MAKSGFGASNGFQADANNRVSVTGKGALVFQTVETPATAGKITLYNSNQTAYTKNPTDATTGAAILSDIKHVLGIFVTRYDTTINDLTTTVNMIGGYTPVNGPTTLAIVGVHNNNDGELYSVGVLGTSF